LYGYTFGVHLYPGDALGGKGSPYLENWGDVPFPGKFGKRPPGKIKEAR